MAETIPPKATVRAYPQELPQFPRRLFGKVACLLDGKEINGVYAYNVPEGWVLTDQRDDDGHLVVVDGELVPLRLEGNVEVLLTD